MEGDAEADGAETPSEKPKKKKVKTPKAGSEGGEEGSGEGGDEKPKLKKKKSSKSLDSPKKKKSSKSLVSDAIAEETAVPDAPSTPAQDGGDAPSTPAQDGGGGVDGTDMAAVDEAAGAPGTPSVMPVGSVLFPWEQDDKLLEEVVQMTYALGMYPPERREPELLAIAYEHIVGELPPGWDMDFDQDRGRTFYWHEEEDGSQWHHPSEQEFKERMRETCLELDDMIRERQKEEEAAARASTSPSGVLFAPEPGTDLAAVDEPSPSGVADLISPSNGDVEMVTPVKQKPTANGGSYGLGAGDVHVDMDGGDEKKAPPVSPSSKPAPSELRRASGFKCRTSCLLTMIWKPILNLLYRKIEVVGHRRVPPVGKGTIFVANHGNLFIDGMMLAVTSPRPLTPLVAKVTLEKECAAKLSACMMDMVPVVRPQDLQKQGTGKVVAIKAGAAADAEAGGAEGAFEITGVGTQFRSELDVGSRVKVAFKGSSTLLITEVVSDTTAIASPPLRMMKTDNGSKIVDGFTVNGEWEYDVTGVIKQPEMYEEVMARLHSGGAVAVFPEGRSSDHGHLLELKAGFAMMALKAAAEKEGAFADPLQLKETPEYIQVSAARCGAAESRRCGAARRGDASRCALLRRALLRRRSHTHPLPHCTRYSVLTRSPTHLPCSLAPLRTRRASCP